MNLNDVRVEVTPAMLDAGMEALSEFYDQDNSRGIGLSQAAVEVYSAMIRVRLGEAFAAIPGLEDGFLAASVEHGSKAGPNA